ncbi:MAG: hypothetical protein Q9217_006412, partial [Psora testacea]
MPNKYSHALVLSNYEAQGLTDFDSLRPTEPIFTKSSKPVKSARSTTSAPQSCSNANDRPDTDGIRLEDSPYPLPQRTVPLQLQHHRIKASIGTQTDINQQIPSEISTPESKSRSANARVEYELYQPPSPPLRAVPALTPKIERQKREEYRTVSPESISAHGVTSSAAETREIAKDDPEWLQSRRLRRRLTNDTAIWDPRPAAPSTTPQTVQQPVLSPYKSWPQRPPTPPLTPKTRNSWESFTLEIHFDDLPPLLPNPSAPPLTNCELRRSTPSLTSSDSDPLPTSLHLTASPSSTRPKTSSGHSNRPPYGSARRPSFNPTNVTIAASPEPQRPNDRCFLDSSTMSDKSSSLDLDADLDPLPPDLTNDPEFSFLTWQSADKSPAIFHLQQEECAPSRASSIDSAAPPPISTGRSANRPIPAYLNEEPMPAKLAKSPKKAKTSFSFLGVGRPNTPKAIPHSATTPGEAPASVS